MNSRERTLAALRHQEPDRVPTRDVPWGTTMARWHKEGMPQDVHPDDFFGYDFTKLKMDTTFRFPVQTIEETDEHIISRDSSGVTVKNLKRGTSVPESIEVTITDKAIWDRHKHRLAPDSSRVETGPRLEANHRVAEQGKFIIWFVPSGYDYFHQVVGAERLLIALADDPEWCRDMFETHAHLIVETCEAMIEAGYHIDALFLGDDQGYRNGLLFSNRVYKETLFEAHKQICGYFHSKNMPVILHSDGDITDRVELFIEAGFDCLQPLEVKSGVDMLELKRKYGDRLAFMGGIDVRKMADPNPAVIEDEIRTKFEVMTPGGGYIYHSDHSVPHDVSLQQYQRVMQLVREYGQYA